MTDSTSWLDDDDALERELRVALASAREAPALRGYSDLRELARGGQGVVYAALQNSTRRTVAVKILRETQASDPGLLRRFEREAELAATLQHPHVVALFDSGVTDDGRPFLVMELVDGPTIEHAPQIAIAHRHGLRRPHLDGLLTMFAEACEAVAYAHRHGVVHRDLKPSNIRVDADGHAKVLDFGLAKDLTPSAKSATLTIGATGSTFLGSLPWASPEQALGRNREVDTRSDVYALGVILYQLLTGRFPYDVDSDLRTALDAIVSTPPVRPRRVAPGIALDLETIVLRCLQKDAERRNQSAGELARDVRNYISGRPIDARRDSAWYTLRSIARRHRGVFIAGGLLAASVLLGLVAAITLWRRADVERVRALANARRAEASMHYFAETLVAVDPDRDGKDVRVLDLVQRAADDLKNRFTDDPDTRDYFYIRLIELLRNLGALPEAIELADEALEFNQTTHGATDPNTIFAVANRALLLHRAGRSAEVVADLEAAADIVRTDTVRYAAPARHVLVNLGLCLIALNRIDDAERAFRDADALHSKSDDRPLLIATSHENLAAILGYRGKHAEAIEQLRLALPILEKENGPEHSTTLRCGSNLAFYLAQSDQLEEAERLMRTNLEISRRRAGPLAIDSLTSLNNHANYLERLGRLDEAQAEYTECLTGRLQVLGEDHPHTIVTIGNLANLASARGDIATASEQFERAIAISIRKHGAQHLETLILRNNLAHALQQAGRTEAAIAQLRIVVADAERGLGVDDFQTAHFRGNLGTDLYQVGEYAEAEVALRECVRVLDARLGAAASLTKNFRRHLAKLLRTTDREAEAAGIEAALEAPEDSQSGATGR